MHIKIFCHCSLFLSGRAKDLSAPLHLQNCTDYDDNYCTNFSNLLLVLFTIPFSDKPIIHKPIPL